DSRLGNQRRTRGTDLDVEAHLDRGRADESFCIRDHHPDDSRLGNQRRTRGTDLDVEALRNDETVWLDSIDRSRLDRHEPIPLQPNEPNRSTTTGAAGGERLAPPR